jgi:hypothetical protein
VTLDETLTPVISSLAVTQTSAPHVPLYTKSFVSKLVIAVFSVESVTDAPVPWKRYQTPPEAGSIVIVLHAAVGSPVLVESNVVPVSEPPHVKTGRLGAVHRSLAGETITVNGSRLEAVPSGFVTLMTPVDAPAGTEVVIVVVLTTTNVAAAPLKLTALAPMKLVPVMVTLAPTAPLVGVKPVIVGGAGMVKAVPDAPVPFGVVTEIKPEVVPAATVAVILVAEFTVKLLAGVPLKESAEAPVKLVPVIVTTVPTGPLVGVKLVMVGVFALGVMVKLAFEMSKK